MLVEKQFEHSAFPPVPANEIGRMGCHVLERLKVRRIILSQCSLDFFRERLGIVNCGLNLTFWPPEVPGHPWYVGVVTSHKQHDLPQGQTAALGVGLPAGR